MSGPLQGLAALPSGLRLLYPLNRRLGGPHNQSERFGEERSCSWRDERTIPLQHRAWPSHYIDWQILAALGPRSANDSLIRVIAPVNALTADVRRSITAVIIIIIIIVIYIVVNCRNINFQCYSSNWYMPKVPRPRETPAKHVVQCVLRLGLILDVSPTIARWIYFRKDFLTQYSGQKSGFCVLCTVDHFHIPEDHKLYIHYQEEFTAPSIIWFTKNCLCIGDEKETYGWQNWRHSKTCPVCVLFYYTPASSGVSTSPKRFSPERVVITNVHVSRMARQL
jgi:hypothetical protein